jgi:uncharacterized membrane protein YidH (DUF202 family)
MYEAALHLYPAAFRRDFGPQMMLDFHEGRLEASRDGRPGGLWRFHAHLAADLTTSLLIAWLRTGLPFLVVAAVVAPLAVLSMLVHVLPPISFVRVPPNMDLDMLALELVIVVVLLVVAATIVFVTWYLRRFVVRLPTRRRW